MRREIIVADLAMAVPCSASVVFSAKEHMYGFTAFFVCALLAIAWKLAGELRRGEYGAIPETRRERTLRFSCAGAELAMGGVFSLLCRRAFQQDQPWWAAFFLLATCWFAACSLAGLRKPRGKQEANGEKP